MAPFQELIKDFNKIRYYARDFFIYGYRSRTEHALKSPRTYDNEKRRLESYLPEMIHWEMGSRGKRVSMRTNPNKVAFNPLHALWETRAFTRNDALLQFLIPDLLRKNPGLSAGQITDQLALQYGEAFSGSKIPDAMTIRNKLKDMTEMGWLRSEKSGKTLTYSLLPSLAECCSPPLLDALSDLLAFSANMSPLGILGYRLYSRLHGYEVPGATTGIHCSPFRYRHNYLFHTLDDQILLELLDCMAQGQEVEFHSRSRRTEALVCKRGIPVRILSSARHGRRFVLTYNLQRKYWFTLRLDRIESVKGFHGVEGHAAIRELSHTQMTDSWGISTPFKSENEEIVVRLAIDEVREKHAITRILREGKHGILTRLGDNAFEYRIQVSDSTEVFPWLRTLISRIVEIEGSNEAAIKRFKGDLTQMARMYGLNQEVSEHGSVQ